MIASPGTIRERVEPDFFAQDTMGGNVPDHIRKNKQSTDFKTRTDDQHVHEQDKRHLHEERGKLATQNEVPPEPEADATGDEG